jgi:hypothetical protein
MNNGKMIIIIVTAVETSNLPNNGKFFVCGLFLLFAAYSAGSSR